MIKDDLMAIVETDENAHEGYGEMCEWAKALEHGQSGLQTEGIERVAFIRFNPNAWKVSGQTIRFKFAERLEVLKDLIHELTQDQDALYSVHHCFYPREDDQKVVKADEETIAHWVKRCSLIV